ncbi:MAG: hypothetical protein ACLTSX_01965 [Collinsella sp.]
MASHSMGDIVQRLCENRRFVIVSVCLLVFLVLLSRVLAGEITGARPLGHRAHGRARAHGMADPHHGDGLVFGHAGAAFRLYIRCDARQAPRVA